MLAAAIVFTLALAIGANTAAFGVIRAVFLPPLPYPEPDRLAILWTEDPTHNIHEEGVSYANFADWAVMNRTLGSMTAFMRTSFTQVSISGPEVPERVQATPIPSNFFDVTGVQPARGRGLSEDDIHEKRPLMVISAALAQRRFGTIDAVGRSLTVDGTPVTITGVMPPGFKFPTGDTDVWMPYSRWVPYQEPACAADFLCVLGRLKPGVTIEQARADMAEVGRRLQQAHPAMPSYFAGFGVNVVPLYAHIYGSSMGLSLWLIGGAVLCILLIALTNIANLLLARLESRRRELALRAALGASTSRIALLLLGETAALALLGGALGLVVAYGGLRWAIHAFAERVPRIETATIDWRVLAFTSLLAATASVLATLAPIWELRRSDHASHMRHRGSRRLKQGLAIAQIALATGLLACAALLLRSYSVAGQTELGYRSSGVLVFELATRDNTGRVAREAMERIRSLPGVSGVAAAGEVFQRRNPDWEIEVESHDSPPAGTPIGDDMATATYFQVMGVPLLRGRLYTPEEEQDPKRRSVIINQKMARTFWPGEDPLGRHFRPVYDDPNRPVLTVVGVVGDMRIAGRESAPIPQWFSPVANYGTPKIVVRAAGDPGALLPAIQRDITAVDAGAVAYRPLTVDQQVNRWLEPRRLSTALASMLAALATLLAAIGIFSLLHYATTVRTQEIGVLASIAAAKVFASVLFGVEPWDVPALGSTTLAIVGLAVLASLLPAWRASKVEAAVVLRRD